jgi:hypothetical protein
MDDHKYRAASSHAESDDEQPKESHVQRFMGAKLESDPTRAGDIRAQDSIEKTAAAERVSGDYLDDATRDAVAGDITGPPPSMDAPVDPPWDATAATIAELTPEGSLEIGRPGSVNPNPADDASWFGPPVDEDAPEEPLAGLGPPGVADPFISADAAPTLAEPVAQVPPGDLSGYRWPGSVRPLEDDGDPGAPHEGSSDESSLSPIARELVSGGDTGPGDSALLSRLELQGITSTEDDWPSGPPDDADPPGPPPESSVIAHASVAPIPGWPGSNPIPSQGDISRSPIVDDAGVVDTLAGAGMGDMGSAVDEFAPLDDANTSPFGLVPSEDEDD